MKKSMYKISEEHIELISQVIEAEGDLTPEIESKLEINESELKSKSIAYLSVIKDTESDIEMIDNEIKRLQSMKKTKLSLVNRLKSTLLDAVRLFGSWETEFQKFGIRKSKQLEILDSTKIPSNFITIESVEKIDKMAIKKAITSGELVEGVQIVECENLKIN